MLQKLYIKNFAIIQEITIDFSSGMTAITGETGAGKSILLGALQMLLGSRADTSVLLDKEQKCIIEAGFSTRTIQQVNTFLKNNDIDTADELIIRREISSQGRSRSFMNDTPVNLQQLQELGSLLVDLHRQFDTLEINQKDFKFEVVDTIAQNGALLSDYNHLFQTWQTQTAALQQLVADKDALKKEYDYISFQYNELEKLNLQENEIEQIEQELAIMSNAENIKKALQEAGYLLTESDEPIVAQLKKVQHLLQTYADTIEKLQPVSERLSNALVEIKDIAAEIETVFDTIQYDEERLNILLERFNDGQRLLKKHGKTTSAELIALQEELSSKLSFTHNLDEHIDNLQKEITDLHEQMTVQAEQLTTVRKAAAVKIDKEVNRLLPLVGMPSARFKTAIQSTAFNAMGADTIAFLFDSNKTDNFQSIAKVASGGELSRLMLCIKSLIANATHLPTLIFDEIDTGISGEVAKQVGLILQQLSKHHQIICVTHLPQIASKSNTHLYIYKKANAQGQMQTQIKYLANQERVNHIAEMLSGDKPTESAITIAREMMNN